MSNLVVPVKTSSILISTLIGAWSEGLHISGRMVCLLRPLLLRLIKTRSRTELLLPRLLASLVGPRLIG